MTDVNNEAGHVDAFHAMITASGTRPEVLGKLVDQAEGWFGHRNLIWEDVQVYVTPQGEYRVSGTFTEAA